MENNLNKVLQTIFYVIWIPIGIVILAGISFMIIFNPFGQMMQNFGSGGQNQFNEQQQMPGNNQQQGQMMDQQKNQMNTGMQSSSMPNSQE